jgi:hypothetical protein
MGTNITITSITGISPYDVYVCDTGYTTCIYVSTINSGNLPYSFMIPSIFSTLTDFVVKVIDDNDCTIIENINI